MDFTLVPICSEIDHDLKYNYKEGYKCEICNKSYISYRCVNCDYGRCSGCHRDILAEKEIKERLKHERIKKDIKHAENKLKKDGLDDWNVMVVNGEICYINKLVKTYSYDYPLSVEPDLSPETIETPLPIPETPSPETPILETPIPETPIDYKGRINRGCVFSDIYNSIKSYLY